MKLIMKHFILHSRKGQFKNSDWGMVTSWGGRRFCKNNLEGEAQVIHTRYHEKPQNSHITSL
jgi:hypothetical protein